MMKNELPCSPAQTGSPLRSDKLRGIKPKQCNTESCGELILVRRLCGGLAGLYAFGGLNTEAELLDAFGFK